MINYKPMLKKIVIYCSISTTIFANENCSIKHVDILNMPQNNNQNDLSWCFAYTAADLLSFYEKTAISSYDIAIKYHAKIFTESSEELKISKKGGSPAEALTIANNELKLCTEKETNYTGGDWQKLSQLIEELDDNSIEFGSTLCHLVSKKSEFYKNLTMDVFNILNSLPRQELLNSILNLSCLSNYSLKNKYSITSTKIENTNQEDLLSKLNEALNQNEPASIGYDIDALLKMPEAESSPYRHASTVIGRRYNSKTLECEYLIRNSWGNDSCPKKNKAIDCADGNFWVGQKKFQENLFEVTTLKVEN